MLKRPDKLLPLEYSSADGLQINSRFLSPYFIYDIHADVGNPSNATANENLFCWGREDDSTRMVLFSVFISPSQKAGSGDPEYLMETCGVGTEQQINTVIITHLLGWIFLSVN